MEKGHPLLEKIDLLRSKFKDPAYTDDLEKIQGWRKDAEELVAKEALCENDTLQQIIKGYEEEIEEMCESLMTGDSTVLKDYDRDRLMDKKRLYKKFVESFDLTNIRKSMESVDKEVSEELANLDA